MSSIESPFRSENSVTTLALTEPKFADLAPKRIVPTVVSPFPRADTPHTHETEGVRTLKSKTTDPTGDKKETALARRDRTYQLQTQGR